MDSSFSPALLRRLAAYSASAGVALAVAPSADAQIVYHDYDPDIVITEWNSTTNLDFDQDGNVDFVLKNLLSYTGGFQDIKLVRPQSADSRNGAFGYYLNFPYPAGIVSRLASGDIIGPDVTYPQNFFSSALVVYGAQSGYGDSPFFNAEGYAGFRFVGSDGQPHYGWLRLKTELDLFSTLDITLFEYAYESAPDTPIEAGDASAALLDGAVNQTVFPASGGTLAYTFSAHNTTDEPLPLDLWIEADGAASFAKRLGSGTLPPGATVTRTVRVQVPAVAPAGTYDVRFKLGDFATEQFITFERYTITKQAGAVAAEGGEAFAVTPAEGDLFASGAASAQVVRAHALSAPRPNPSSGEVALTLTVAESQAVRVEVLDALGRRVAVLLDGAVGAGTEQRLTFDGAGLPSGVYVVRVTGEDFADARVVTLTR